MARKVWVVNEQLASADVNSYLMDQSVMSFAGTAARGSAIPTPYEGATTYLQDTNFVQVHDGTSWNSLAYKSQVDAIPTAGLVPVVPTSITKTGGTATVNSIGQVYFDSTTAITFNGVFTSAYKNYRIVLSNMVSNSGSLNGLYLQLTQSATASTAGYITAGENILSNATSNLESGEGLSSHRFGYFAWTAYSGGSIDIFNPFEANTTTAVSDYVGAHSTAGRTIYTNSSMLHNYNLAYDGFNIIPSGGVTLHGWLTVYGYND